MAPRQLRLEPIEADSTADKGAKRVRVDSTEESSTQVQNSARAIAWCCDTSPPPIYRPTRGPRRGLHVLHLSGRSPLAGWGATRATLTDIGRLAHVLSAILVAIRARPWMDYVRSAANLADLPSRFDIEGLWVCIPPSRHYGFKPLSFWDPIGCSYVSLMRELV
eukprot:scaffold10462_cov119-Isochrysis_galbana.AAC.1